MRVGFDDVFSSRPGQFDSTGRELATSPDLHALHILCGGIRHRSHYNGSEGIELIRCFSLQEDGVGSRCCAQFCAYP
jgi:hypothetical protein